MKMVSYTKQLIDASTKHNLKTFDIPIWKINILNSFYNYEQDSI